MLVELIAALPLLVQAVPQSYEVVGLPASAPQDVPRTYPERRWFVQSQGWWRPKNDTSPHGEGQHIHVETAFPLLQTVSGVIRFDVRIQLHEQPRGNVLNKFRILDESGVRLIETAPNIRPDEHGNADVWLRGLMLDTRKLKNGRRELRITANMTQRTDGNRQYQSTGWLCYVYNAVNGAAENYRSERWCEARGWYTGASYANARLADVFPFEPISPTVSWQPRVELVPGSSGKPVSSHLVTLNPSFHDGNRGQVLKEGSGPYKGTVRVPAGLSQGVHRLVLVTHQDISTGRNSGVLVIPFVVSP